MPRLKTLLTVLAALCLAAAALPAAAQNVPAQGQADPAQTAPPSGLTVAAEHPRLLFTPLDLNRLRQRAWSNSPAWKSLLAWAGDPDRNGGDALDGPGLALVALITAEENPELAAIMGKKAVKCAFSAVRAGVVESMGEDFLRDPQRPGAPEELAALGYDLIFARQDVPVPAPVKRITQTRLYIEFPMPMSKLTSVGNQYFLVMSDPAKAAPLVRSVALTLDWAWSFFTPKERKLAAYWLVLQARALGPRGYGCFDAASLSLLNVEALAGLAADGIHPGGGALAAGALEKGYKTTILPCLMNLGEGGAWFAGESDGAGAGLELVLFTAAMRTAAGIDPAKDVPWFRDRLGWLSFHILPGMHKSPRGPYHLVYSGADETLAPEAAADLARLQLAGLAWLDPAAPMAGQARSLLVTNGVSQVLDGRLAALEFIWLDPDDPLKPLVLAPLAACSPVMGRAVSRTSWLDSATWLSFESGPHFALPQTLGALNFSIYHRGPLSVPGGVMDGLFSQHALNYRIRSVAHNTLVIDDPEEYSWHDMREGIKPHGTYANDGGQRSWAAYDARGAVTQAAPWTASGWDQGRFPYTILRNIYNAARLEAFLDKPRFCYMRGNATGAYQGSTSKAMRVVRHLFHLRPGGADDAQAAEAIVLLDELELSRPGLTVRQVFHFPTEPQAGNGMSSKGPGRQSGRARIIRVDTGQSQILVVSLAGQEPRVDIIGGEGLASAWVNGRNYPPETVAIQSLAVDPCPWRAEFIAGSDEDTTKTLLTVLLPSDKNGPPPPDLERLAGLKGNVTGVVFRDPHSPRVVAMRTGPPSAGAEVGYRFQGGRSRHLVAGLAPHTSYEIKAGDGTVTLAPGPGLKTGEEGVLSFRLEPGSASGGRE